MARKSLPRPFRAFRDIRTFLISISIIVALFLILIFYVRYKAVNVLLLETMRHEAESYANLIVVTRHWNAENGGLYAFKSDRVHTNEYLKQIGVDPDIRTADGRILTLKNPAIMTREISKLTEQTGGVRFHMISLKPLNSENAPDSFERDALTRFEGGEPPIWSVDRKSDPPSYRYIFPLAVSESCLPCHARQGYKLGDIRGGVSIMIPADYLLRQMRQNRNQVVVDFLITAGLLFAIFFFLTRKLAGRLLEAQSRLRHVAITDDLTGLRNRRSIMKQLETEYLRAIRTGQPLSIVILDIDYFKKVNDKFGHQFGDEVLRTVAREMVHALRPYDLLGRIGGEEFLIASPGSTMDDIFGLAERIRMKIQERKIENNGMEVTVTISAGVTTLGKHDAQAGALLARADRALYEAKQQGRNRVMTGAAAE